MIITLNLYQECIYLKLKQVVYILGSKLFSKLYSRSSPGGGGRGASITAPFCIPRSDHFHACLSVGDIIRPGTAKSHILVLGILVFIPALMVLNCIKNNYDLCSHK